MTGCVQQRQPRLKVAPGFRNRVDGIEEVRMVNQYSDSHGVGPIMPCIEREDFQKRHYSRKAIDEVARSGRPSAMMVSLNSCRADGKTVGSLTSVGYRT